MCHDIILYVIETKLGIVKKYQEWFERHQLFNKIEKIILTQLTNLDYEIFPIFQNPIIISLFDFIITFNK
jgi:hypothetical protein